jgi:hypothetical protein
MSASIPHVDVTAENEVDRILARAGLPVTEEERARLIRLFPQVREWTDAVRLAETRYAEPALIYPATYER